MTLKIEDSQLKLSLTSIATHPDCELELPSQTLAQMSPALHALSQAKPASGALAQMVTRLNREFGPASGALAQMVTRLNREFGPASGALAQMVTRLNREFGPASRASAQMMMMSQNRAQMSPALQTLGQTKPAMRALAQMATSLNRGLGLTAVSRAMETQKRISKPLTPQVLATLTPHVQQRDPTLYTVGGTDSIYMPEQADKNEMPLLFISHSSEDKDFATEISAELSHLGIASFIAHRDIDPMADWWSVIIHALGTVDGLIALLTPPFKSSDWTNQEVGAVLVRGVPTIAVQLGIEPYGLMSRWQAIQGRNKDPRAIANEIRDAFIRSRRPR